MSFKKVHRFPVSIFSLLSRFTHIVLSSGTNGWSTWTTIATSTGPLTRPPPSTSLNSVAVVFKDLGVLYGPWPQTSFFWPNAFHSLSSVSPKLFNWSVASFNYYLTFFQHINIPRTSINFPFAFFLTKFLGLFIYFCTDSISERTPPATLTRRIIR